MGKGKQLATRTDPVYQMYYEPFLQQRQRSSTRTQLLNRMLERRLYELAMNRFEWIGLPDEIDIRWMEMALQDDALSVFYMDKALGRYLAMRGSGTGNVNMLGNPTEFIVWGNGVYGTKRLKVDECVPIWSNYTRMPDSDIVRLYGSKLADIDRTIEINAKNARQSKVLAVPQNARLSAAQINKQLEEGSNSIEVLDGWDITSMVQVLDLGVNPDTILNLSILRGRIWAECMMMLGINSGNTDKKERMVAAEVSSNDDMVGMIRESNLNARQQACEQINTMFGLNVSVDYKTDHVTAELKDSQPAGAGSGEQ